MASSSTLSFSDLPFDIHVHIFSFLSAAELSSFAATSRRSAALLHPSSPLWPLLCHRRWSSKTLIQSWPLPPSPLLFRTLDRWESLIGFWRRIGAGTPDLVFFDWGPSFITGSKISPSAEPGSLSVVKSPFLWLGISRSCEPVSFLCSNSRAPETAEDVDKDLVPVSVSSMGKNHLVVEERFFEEEVRVPEDGLVESPPDRLMFEIYQHFANRTSPGGEKGGRRQRRKGRERFGRRRWETEHFVKIVDYCPTPGRPLQGLWKGICRGMNLEFYLVTYDDIGGITCRRVGDSGEPFSGYSPVFWTSNTTFLESPFSREDQDLYSSREHLQPVALNWSNLEGGVVSRILCINSSYDIVIPDLSGSSGDPRNVEGRIWEYENGTFGFGFLRDNFIVDLKHIALDGHLLDAVELL